MLQFMRVNDELCEIYAKYAKYAHPGFLFVGTIRKAKCANYAKNIKTNARGGLVNIQYV